MIDKNKKKKERKRTEWIANLLENNHITGLIFEGVNPMTEIWQQVNEEVA